ncbi:hypothetical protein Fmac_002579 [Flemingia macrophylla]|uniref:Uncharacterized protein n=1 Tax=Flemingia macrophylla TaxID=520843 RepID=A0ABD1NKC8_9FABA
MITTMLWVATTQWTTTLGTRLWEGLGGSDGDNGHDSEVWAGFRFEIGRYVFRVCMRVFER